MWAVLATRCYVCLSARVWITRLLEIIFQVASCCVPTTVSGNEYFFSQNKTCTWGCTTEAKHVTAALNSRCTRNWVSLVCSFTRRNWWTLESHPCASHWETWFSCSTFLPHECFWTSARPCKNISGKGATTCASETCQPQRHFGASKTIKATGRARNKNEVSLKMSPTGCLRWDTRNHLH